MAITIGSNIASLQSQRRLFDTSEKLATVFERLASGQRINRAADDAAGLAISESLNTDRRVFTQAVRNLNDGQSALNIADSTVEELSSIVIRIQELATQSASGSLSNQQRESLDTEAQELREEFFRVSREAEFNGLRLFDGSIENGLRLQGGYGVDGSIVSSLGGALADGTFANAVTLGTGGFSVSANGDLNGDGILDFVSDNQVFLAAEDGSFASAFSYHSGTAEDVELLDVNNDGTLDIVFVERSTDSLSVLIGNGDGSFGAEQTLSVATGAASPQEFDFGDFNGDGNLDIVVANSSSGEAIILLGGGDGSFEVGQTVTTGAGDVSEIVVGDLNGDGSLDLVMGSYNDGEVFISLGDGSGLFGASSLVASDSAVTDLAARDFDGDGYLDIVYASSDGTSVIFNAGSGVSFGNAVEVGPDDTRMAEVADVNGDGFEDVVLVNDNQSRVEVYLNDGGGAFTLADIIDNTLSFDLADFDADGVLDVLGGSGSGSLSFGNTREGINPLLEFSLSTQADALQALAPLENKLNSLTAQRGVIGAFQSRLETATNTLRATTENYAAAESRIRDADIAAESANLTRLNILRQAASSVLAQANQQPALSLQLLG